MVGVVMEVVIMELEKQSVCKNVCVRVCSSVCEGGEQIPEGNQWSLNFFIINFGLKQVSK
jgi:hypothetical protein